MSHKAICPRGHVWDPSTLAGLPPSDRPRCPICGEAEPRRARHVLTDVLRCCRANPLAAVLSLTCLLLAAALILVSIRSSAGVRNENENTTKIEYGSQKSSKAIRANEGEEASGNDLRRLERAVAMEKAKWSAKYEEQGKQLREAEQQRKDALRQRDEQAIARKVAEELARTAENVRQKTLDRRAETVRRLARMHVANGTRLMEDGDLSASLMYFAEALRLAQRDKLPVETHRLRLSAVLAQCPRPLQVWTHKGKLNAARIGAGGKRILTAGADGAVRIYDTAAGKRIGEPLPHGAAVRQALFRPDGKRILTAAADMTVHLWDIDTGKEAFPAIQLMGPIVALAFRADGRRFLTVTDKPDPAMGGAAEPELRVWNADTGEAFSEQALGSDISPKAAAFSPDGKRVLAICRDRCARIWDVTTERQVGPDFAHSTALTSASFSPDGECVLTAGADGTARLRAAKTGEATCPPLKHGAAVRAACFDANGRYVLTAGADRSVRVWNAKTGETAGPALRHADEVNQAVFSPDGRYVLTVCADGAARLWDYLTGKEVLPPLRHGRALAEAEFTPAGDMVLTRAGRTVRLWNLTICESPHSPTAATQAKLRVFSGDGKRELRVTESAVRIYDTATNQTVGGTLPHKNKVTATAFSADHKRVLTLSHQRNGDELEGVVIVWETATGRPIGDPLIHPRSVLEVRLSADGKRVLTACADRRARLWNVEKSILVGEPMDHKEDLFRALFVPGGNRILTVDVEGGMRLWDAANAEAVGPAWGHRRAINHLDFSADGKRLVTAGVDGTARVWEASTGRELATTAKHDAAFTYAVFSRDGKHIATVGDDRTARVWDAVTGKPSSPPLRHRNAVSLAAFSADGRQVVTTAADGVHVWNADTGEPISPLLERGKALPTTRNVALDKEGRLVFRADKRPVNDLLHLAEVLNGQRMSSAGETTPIDGVELEKGWRALQKKYGKDFAADAERATAWHHRGAAECEQRELWLGAVRHLDRLIAEKSSPQLYARRAGAHAARKRWESAEADYTKALAGDAKRWDLWAGRAAVEAALKHWQKAASDYTKAIESKSDQAELWAGRGRAEAELGDWNKAADDLGKAVSLGASDVSMWRQHALALLAAGKEADYRRACGRLVRHFGSDKEEATARAVAWTCSLTDGAINDLKSLIERGERTLTTHPQSAEDLRCLAALLYRDGRFEAALKRMQETMNSSGGKVQARDRLLMAMATQRLGHADDAKKWLDKADRLHSKEQADSWSERLVYRVWHREAETLIKGPKK